MIIWKDTDSKVRFRDLGMLGHTFIQTVQAHFRWQGTKSMQFYKTIINQTNGRFEHLLRQGWKVGGVVNARDPLKNCG